VVPDPNTGQAVEYALTSQGALHLSALRFAFGIFAERLVYV
jgi:hypothetical protein